MVNRSFNVYPEAKLLCVENFVILLSCFFAKKAHAQSFYGFVEYDRGYWITGT